MQLERREARAQKIMYERTIDMIHALFNISARDQENSVQNI